MGKRYSIELARPEHSPALPAIEKQAASLFHGWNAPESVIEEATPIKDFQVAQEAGQYNTRL
jgi:hypothetical protein